MPQIKSKYIPLYTSKKRYFILTGGRGSGKTFVVQDFLVRLLEQKGQGILYTRFTMKSAEKTIIPLFVSYIESIADSNNYHITKTSITNKKTGSFILFSGIKTSSGDQTGNLKSLPNITTWIIEEGEDFNNENTFTDIDDSIRNKEVHNRVIWIQNPTTREHFIYKRFFENTHKHDYINGFKYQVSTHPEVEHIHTTYLDNLEHLDPKKIKQWELVKETNPKKYANKYIGAWLDKAEGVVFENWSIGNFNPDNLQTYFGQDFGFSNDPTTLVEVAVDKSKKKIYAKELLYKPLLTTSDIAKINKQYCSDKMIIGDSSEPRLIAELSSFCNIVPAIKGAGSITAGVMILQDYEIVVTQESTNLIKELNNHVYADKGSKTYMDEFNHLLDALRYVVYYINRSSVFTPLDW